jgi:uncharacterized SAM-binding protein YcdF (DUF218 family)
MVRCAMHERKTQIAPAATVAAAGISGAVFILYYCAICLAEREIARGFSLVWPIAGTILLLCAANMRRVGEFFARPVFRKRAVKIPVAVFVALFISISLVFFARIVSHPRAASRDATVSGDVAAVNGRAPKYVIVLGGGVHPDGRPSATLAGRLRTAASYARDHPEATLVVTGGRLKREPLPEADSMARWLVDDEHIEGARIIREPKARDTIQNFAYSIALIESAEAPVAVVTSGFHMNRALFLARRAGLAAVIPLSAPSPALMEPNNYLREVGAWWKLSIRLALSLDAPSIIDLAFGQ